MHWNPDPLMFHVGPIAIHWYGFFFTLGLLATIWVGHEVFKQRGLAEGDASNLSFILPVALFVGAHVGYVVFYRFGDLLRDPSVFWDFRQGLSSHGGGIGIVVAVWLYVRIRQRKQPELRFAEYADAVMLAAVWLFPFIRLGNFFNSEIVGRTTDLPWGVIFDRRGFTEPRHPVQLYETAMSVALIGVSLWLHRHRDRIKSGATITLLLALYFTGRFLLEFTKEFQVVDEGSVLTMGARLCLPPAVLCWGLLLWMRPILVEPSTEPEADAAAPTG